MELLIMNFSPASSRVIPLRSKHSLQHPVLYNKTYHILVVQ
jgi:hypothetical protein